MVRIKVCGVTSLQDASKVAKSGADAMGMVFYGPSPRHIDDLSLARDIALVAGPFVSVVGLFVDPAPSYISSVLSSVPLNLIQFHGGETEEFCRGYDRPYLKAIRMKPGLDVENEVSHYPSASGILLDAYVKGVPGGTGTRFEWDRIPKDLTKPIILAGGLSPENVREAIHVANPYAVDVSGGIEQSPGVKDPAKIMSFVASVQAATRS